MNVRDHFLQAAFSRNEKRKKERKKERKKSKNEKERNEV
jgi:hypothetical protein